MISRRSKCLIGGFAAGLLAFATLQVILFKLLREAQAAVSTTGQMPPPQLLQHGTIMKLGPGLLIIFYAGCLCAVLALISLILDNRSRRKRDV
jgi:hypothetical protein